MQLSVLPLVRAWGPADLMVKAGIRHSLGMSGLALLAAIVQLAALLHLWILPLIRHQQAAKRGVQIELLLARGGLRASQLRGELLALLQGMAAIRGLRGG